MTRDELASFSTMFGKKSCLSHPEEKEAPCESKRLTSRVMMTATPAAGRVQRGVSDERSLPLAASCQHLPRFMRLLTGTLCEKRQPFADGI